MEVEVATSQDLAKISFMARRRYSGVQWFSGSFEGVREGAGKERHSSSFVSSSHSRLWLRRRGVTAGAITGSVRLMKTLFFVL